MMPKDPTNRILYIILLSKNWWHYVIESPKKGPIRFFEKNIIKYEKRNNLEVIATLFPNINKWIANKNIDNELFNNY